jgi:hypothetical protein
MPIHQDQQTVKTTINKCWIWGRLYSKSSACDSELTSPACLLLNSSVNSCTKQIRVSPNPLEMRERNERLRIISSSFICTCKVKSHRKSEKEEEEREPKKAKRENGKPKSKSWVVESTERTRTRKREWTREMKKSIFPFDISLTFSLSFSPVSTKPTTNTTTRRHGGIK